MTAEDRSKMSVLLTCTDMSVSVPFYRDSLGFEMKESWPSANEPQWCNLVLGGQSVMLGAAMDPDRVGEYCHDDAEVEAYYERVARDFRANKPASASRST